ncbi:MAG: hypothetical protein WC417_01710 [Candidatus Omnitrophota bacterium]|jgi:hypothetical protein
MKTKVSILILSVIYCGYLLVTLAAGHYHSYVLNPLNAEYYFKEKHFARAIEAEPGNSAYHLSYGLELLRTLPKDKASAQSQLRLAKREFACAAELKPYSKLYRQAYNVYAEWIDKQI